MPGVVKVVRYGLYFADLNPTRGAEISKVRPVVVVSHRAMNDALGTVLVCPITSVLHPTWRSRVPCRCAGKPAEVAVDQIRTIAKERFTKRLGVLGEGPASAIRSLIVEMYGSP